MNEEIRKRPLIFKQSAWGLNLSTKVALMMEGCTDERIR